MEWKAITRPFIWKFVPNGLIRWNDAARLSSKQLIMVDQVETPGGSTMRAIAHFQSISETDADHSIHSQGSRIGSSQNVHVEVGESPRFR